MKILIVNKFLYPKGGAETYILRIGEQLEKMGHEVQYFGMYDQQNTVGNRLNLYTENVDFHQKSLKMITYPFHIIYNKDAKKKMSSILDDFQPDIVHLNNINFQVTPSIIDVIDKKGIPIIWTAHDYQILCPSHLMYDFEHGEPCEKCLEDEQFSHCRKGKCIHHSLFKSIIGELEAKYYKKHHTYEKVSKFICPSKFMQDKLNQKAIYVNKTIFIQNFMEKMELDNDLPKGNYVLYFGRLSEEKGIRMLLNACKKNPNIHFIIAGGGPEVKQCKNIPNVEFVGFKNGKELRDLIQQAKFSIYPSVWYENCPLSILESQSLGTPVIASDRGGIPELIQNRKTGIVIKDMNEDRLAKTIYSLDNDLITLSKMTRNCKQTKESFMLIDSYCQQLEKVYQEVLNDRRKN